jgi:hypothetical protein
MGLSVPNKPLPKKRNGHQIEEAAYRMGENLCQLYIWQWIINQNSQEAQKLNSQRFNDPMKKWTNQLTEIFSRKKSKWLKTHEEMLNIPDHKGNANKIKIKTPHHSY